MILFNKEAHKIYLSHYIVKIMKSRKLLLTGPWIRWEVQQKHTYGGRIVRILQLRKSKRLWLDDIKFILTKYYACMLLVVRHIYLRILSYIEIQLGPFGIWDSAVTLRESAQDKH